MARMMLCFHLLSQLILQEAWHDASLIFQIAIHHSTDSRLGFGSFKNLVAPTCIAGASFGAPLQIHMYACRWNG